MTEQQIAHLIDSLDCPVEIQTREPCECKQVPMPVLDSVELMAYRRGLLGIFAAWLLRLAVRLGKVGIIAVHEDAF